MEVYKSKYLRILYFEDEQLIEMVWLPKSEAMTNQDYQQECLAYLDAVKKFNPRRAIPDMRDMNFPIAPDLQEWTNQTIFPTLLEVGLNNVGIVVSTELISQLAVEQTMEEIEGIKFTTKYFDDKEDARKWILSK